MRPILIMLLLVCACINIHAQTNFVMNPGFEEYYKCPDDFNQISRCKSWTCAVDTIGEPRIAPEYFNICAGPGSGVGIPGNIAGFQDPKSGNALAGAHFFYDKTSPTPSGVPPNWRDYLQGRLIKSLLPGKIYCVSFWANLAEISGYAHNKIGVYIDNGGINVSADPAGTEITSLIPQIYSAAIIFDTTNWIKIEGSFLAKGDETHITIGNFFPNPDLTKIKVPYTVLSSQYSYYLIDDVSVIPIDLAADAGKDSHAELGKKVQIGRVGDTTAQGLDCKWYKKGVLIDSGAIISVNAGATVGAVDTYVVVQTICGLIKTDTVTVKTVPVGFREYGTELEFAVYPNPSNGSLTITPHAVIPQGSVNAAVYDLLGRVIFNEPLNFTNNEASININTASGIYILEVIDAEGNSSRQRIEIRN